MQATLRNRPVVVKVAGFFGSGIERSPSMLPKTPAALPVKCYSVPYRYLASPIKAGHDGFARAERQTKSAYDDFVVPPLDPLTQPGFWDNENPGENARLDRKKVDGRWGEHPLPWLHQLIFFTSRQPISAVKARFKQRRPILCPELNVGRGPLVPTKVLALPSPRNWLLVSYVQVQQWFLLVSLVN